ncbi:MAG: FAD-dependent monooxygenase [Rhodobacteraceae bacterium]|nr:FAD-dependent monooxygenase [Paracoccaceae bacterium]
MSSLRIAVAGAGVGGLAVAAGLARAGHRIQIFDRFQAPAPVGSGLVIQPVGQSVLQALGVLSDAQHLANPIRRMIGHEANTGRRVLDVTYAPRVGLGIHRAALFDILLKAAVAAGVVLQTGHEAQAVDGSFIRFADALPAGPFDLIVDACGAGSPLSPMRSADLPYGALWATIDWPAQTELSQDHLRQVYRRADRMMGVLPIGREPGQTGQRTAIFWSLPRTAFDNWREAGLKAWREEALQFWPEFQPFADQIVDPDQFAMARYAHGTLRQVTAPGLAHIGDAAHRASPQLGQGANMALLDALALIRALDRAESHVPVALQWYGQARKWHVRSYQAISRLFTPQFQSDSRLQPWLRDRILFPLSQVPPLPRILTRLVCGDLLAPMPSLDRDSFRRLSR